MVDANGLNEQGKRLFQQGDYETAYTVFEQAQRAYAEQGMVDQVAEMQVNMGLMKHTLGDSSTALTLMQQALETFVNMEDGLRTAQVLGNMGRVYLKLNDHEQAYQFYGETLLAMADLQMKDGKMMSAAGTYEAGLEQLDDLNPNQKMIKNLLSIRNRFLGGSGN